MPRLCRLEDIEDGNSRGFALREGPGNGVFVVRRGDTVVVYRDDCPHDNVPMAWRRDAYLNADRTRIVCFAHGAEFEIGSGLCTLGPCVGQYLSRIDHEIDVDGWIVVERSVTP